MSFENIINADGTGAVDANDGWRTSVYPISFPGASGSGDLKRQNNLHYNEVEKDVFGRHTPLMTVVVFREEELQTV